jgi:ADP-ribose pyrophosphatase YjhB (NUDIX family)
MRATLRPVLMNASLRSIARMLGTLWRRLPLSIQRVGSALGATWYKVGVIAVIFDDQDRLLLLEHSFRAEPWGLPGGFLNRGERPDQTLRRELHEEVGLEVSSLDLVFVSAPPGGEWVEIVFRGRATGVPRPDGVEVTAAGWFTAAEIPAKMTAEQYEHISTMLHHAVAR